jgi:hypothetical protein
MAMMSLMPAMFSMVSTVAKVYGTSFTGLYHQLVDSSQLSIVVRPHLIRLDVWHVDGTSSLVILGRVRDKKSQRFELRIFDGIKHSQSISPGIDELVDAYKRHDKIAYFW